MERRGGSCAALIAISCLVAFALIAQLSDAVAEPGGAVHVPSVEALTRGFAGPEPSGALRWTDAQRKHGQLTQQPADEARSEWFFQRAAGDCERLDGLDHPCGFVFVDRVQVVFPALPTTDDYLQLRALLTALERREEPVEVGLTLHHREMEISSFAGFITAPFPESSNNSTLRQLCLNTTLHMNTLRSPALKEPSLETRVRGCLERLSQHTTRLTSTATYSHETTSGLSLTAVMDAAQSDADTAVVVIGGWSHAQVLSRLGQLPPGHHTIINTRIDATSWTWSENAPPLFTTRSVAFMRDHVSAEDLEAMIFRRVSVITPENSAASARDAAPIDPASRGCAAAHKRHESRHWILVMIAAWFMLGAAVMGWLWMRRRQRARVLVPVKTSSADDARDARG